MYKHLVILFSLVALIGCAGGGADIKQDPDLSKDCTILGNCDDVPDTTDTDTDDDVDTDADGDGSDTVRAVKITRGARDGETKDFVLYEDSDLTFRASYGSESYVWEITNLPEGLTAIDLDKKVAKIEGRFTNFDEKIVSVKVCDAEDAANCDARSFKIVVKDNISITARFRSSEIHMIGGGLVSRADLVSESVKVLPPFPSDPCSYLRIEVKGHMGGYALETSDEDVKFAELPADVGTCESLVRKHLPAFAGSSSSTMPVISKTYYLYVEPVAYGTTHRNVTVTVKDSAGNEDKIKFSSIVFEQDPCSTPPVITQVFDPDHAMLVEDGDRGFNEREPNHLNTFKFQASGGKGPYIWSVNGKKIGDALSEDFDYQMSVETGDTFVVSTSFENLGQILCYTYGSDRPTTLAYPSEKACTGGRLYSQSMAIDVQDSCLTAQHASKSYSFPLRPSASQFLSGSKINMDVTFGDTCGDSGWCEYNDWGGYIYIQVRFFNKDNRVIAQFEQDPVDGGHHSWTLNPGATAGYGDVPVTEIVRAEFHGHDTNMDCQSLDTTLHSLAIWDKDSYLLWDTVHDPYWETSGDDNWENIFTAANFTEISRATDRHVEWKKCDDIAADPKLEVLRDSGACDID